MYDSFPQFLSFLAYEDAATGIRQFQGLLVPGLLQSESYVRALIGSVDDPQLAEQYIQVRLKRQELLRRDAGPDMSFVLDEGILHRVVGDRDIMIEQLRHLRTLNASSHINIQIVPFSAGMVAGMARSFTLLELSNEINGDEVVDYVIDVEDISRDSLLRDSPDAAAVYVEAFYRIRNVALPVDESNRLIDSVLQTFSASE